MRLLLHLKYNISLKKTNVLRVIRYKLQWRKEQLEIEYNTIIKWAIAFVSLKITNALIIWGLGLDTKDFSCFTLLIILQVTDTMLVPSKVSF